MSEWALPMLHASPRRARPASLERMPHCHITFQQRTKRQGEARADAIRSCEVRF
jgi:hypothetical protein